MPGRKVVSRKVQGVAPAQRASPARRQCNVGVLASPALAPLAQWHDRPIVHHALDPAQRSELNARDDDDADDEFASTVPPRSVRASGAPWRLGDQARREGA